MAKEVFKRTITTTDKVAITGILNDDMTVELDGQTVSITDKLNSFVGKAIDITIAEKTTQEVIE